MRRKRKVAFLSIREFWKIRIKFPKLEFLEIRDCIDRIMIIYDPIKTPIIIESKYLK